MRRAHASYFAFAVLLLAPALDAGATLFVKGTDDTASLANAADTIVVGTVTELHAEWDGGRIVTRATVKVERRVRGKPNATMELVVPGGKVGNIRAHVLGAPRLRVAQRSLLLTRQVGATYRVIGLAHGVLPVVELADGEQLVRWLPAGQSGHEWKSLDHVARALSAPETEKSP